MLKTLSLQMRLTVLTGLIIIASAFCLTITSNVNAERSIFNIMETVPLIMEGQLATDQSNTPNAATIVDISNQNSEEAMTAAVTVTAAKLDFAYSSIIYMVLIIVVGMGVTFLTAGNVLKPVRELSHLVKNISDQNLFERIEGFGNKDEISELAASFNIMIHRLEQTFDSQRQFVSNASHELKTPLTIIKSSIQVLKLDDEPTLEEYKDNVEITEQSIQRLIQVVEGLLELTTQQLEVFSEFISLQAVFYEILQEIKPLMEAKNVTVAVEEQAVESRIQGSYHLIYRAFFNLIENAVKYNKLGGGVKIQILSEPNQFRIQVCDTGIGMAEQELTRILEPFYRVDSSRSRDIGGSGLGLSIVKTIIEKHHGKILVQSEKDIGSVFEVILPVKQVLQSSSTGEPRST